MTNAHKTEWFCFQIDKLKNSMYLTSMSILKNKEDAEDAIQNTLLISYNHLDDLKLFDKFKPWILKILTNECYKILKKRTYNLDIDAENGINIPSVSDSVQDETSTIWESILLLELKYRTVIILYYYEDMSIKNISKTLDISVDNAKKRLSRARKMLKTILEKEDFS